MDMAARTADDPSMTRRSAASRAAITAALLLTLAPALVAASPLNAHIRLVRIATGLSRPVFITSARDGTGRLFIVEKTGRIRIYRNGVLYAGLYLNISTLVSTGSEQGLLGLAFSPSF